MKYWDEILNSFFLGYKDIKARYDMSTGGG